MDVGVVGLGSMGSGMALKLVKAGHTVRVWNRSPGPVERLAKEGAIAVKEPQDALQGEAALTMLADDDAIAAVLIDSGALAKARRGLVHVVTATISVDFAKRLEKIHAELGLGYVAAPVLGRPDIAAAGDLNVLAAGDPAHLHRVQPLLDAIGKQTWVIGAAPHHANLAKIACNFTLSSAIEAMAESIALARRNDVDPEKLIEVFTGTLFAAPAYKVYGPAILKGKFEEAGFKLVLGLKDVRLALTASEKSGAPLPFAGILRDNFVDAIAHGDADKDWAAVSKVALRRAGLEGE
ncbi:MAG: NAD(P)-dependent oxidoreductase [Methylovirgula sp.]|jgi:3-hydroxyisobutyrate dehydrogenase-like beta-hydroxyacid dehydrogenase